MRVKQLELSYIRAKQAGVQCLHAHCTGLFFLLAIFKYFHKGKLTPNL